MKQKTRAERRWILVSVWRRMPDEVKVFSDFEAARKELGRVRRKLNPHEDEAGLFEASAVGPATQAM